MDQTKLKELLESVAAGAVAPDDALDRLRSLPFEDLGFVKIDHHRSLRKGFPETIFGAGKTPEQVVAIIGRMRAHGSNVLATRCSRETVDAVLAAHPDVVHHEAARALTLIVNPPEPTPGYVCRGLRGHERHPGRRGGRRYLRIDGRHGAAESTTWAWRAFTACWNSARRCWARP